MLRQMFEHFIQLCRSTDAINVKGVRGEREEERQIFAQGTEVGGDDDLQTGGGGREPTPGVHHGIALLRGEIESEDGLVDLDPLGTLFGEALQDFFID